MTASKPRRPFGGRCQQISASGVYRVGTLSRERDVHRGRGTAAQRPSAAMLDLFLLGSARKWSSEPLLKQENRAVARFPRALCRTRTGDPFLTIERRPCLRTRRREPKSQRTRGNPVSASGRIHRQVSARSSTAWVPWASPARAARLTLLAWLAQGALRRQPPRLLAGNRGNAAVILVVVQNGEIRCFGGRGDQEIGVFH